MTDANGNRLDSQSAWVNRGTSVTKPVYLVDNLPPMPTDKAINLASPQRKKKEILPKPLSVRKTENASLKSVAKGTKIGGSRLDASSTTANKGFTRVVNKNRSARKHSMVIGTGRYLTMLVSRLNPCTSQGEVEHYIERTHNITTKCTQL